MVSGTNILDNSLDEFIELQNITAAPVQLFDAQFPLNTWRVRGGIAFDFPPNHSLAAGECLLVVNFDPANTALLNAFREKLGVPTSVAVFGPYEGKLANSGAAVELQRPDTPQAPPHPDAGFVPRIVVDRVKYSDSAPWPTTPDGHGDSLQRCQPDAYGSDPINWAGAPLTPGIPGVGTAIRSFQRNGQTITICFSTCAGRSYSLQSSTSPSASNWTRVTDVTATITGDQCVNIQYSTTDNARFFHVVTPAQP
jgi:hypothetical protein